MLLNTFTQVVGCLCWEEVQSLKCVLIIVQQDLRFLEEWVFNGQPDNQGKAKKWLSDNNIPHDQNNILFYLTCRLKDDEDVHSVLPDEYKWMTMKDLCFDTLKKVSIYLSSQGISLIIIL